jgi:hypothetical protein
MPAAEEHNCILPFALELICTQSLLRRSVHPVKDAPTSDCDTSVITISAPQYTTGICTGALAITPARELGGGGGQFTAVRCAVLLPRGSCSSGSAGAPHGRRRGSKGVR